jgi:hypothetical protein
MCERFLFFGCWNSINCEIKNNKDLLYRDVILQYINKYEKIYKKKYIDIFIAGDNWYATTFLKYANHNNIKLYLKDILISGYYKLYELGNTIHIAVGNHDEDIGDEDMINIELKKNCMINTQRHYIKKIIDNMKNIKGDRSLTDRSLTDRSFIVRKKIYNDSLIDLKNFIIIDEVPTLEKLKDIGVENDKNINLYVEDFGVIEKNNYIMIVINTNYFYITTATDYLDKLKKKLIELKSKDKTLFVMGHIPLFTYKKKKEDTAIIKMTDINSYTDIIQYFYDILVDNNCIYLCADTHNFSIMKITKNNKTLIQITSGTGGADPDIIDENPTTLKQYSIRYKEINIYDISYISVNSFGFSSVNINKTNDIYISYNNVIKINNEPGIIYNYCINKGQIDGKFTLNIHTNITKQIGKKHITKIINEIKEGKYKDNFCKLINDEDIETINKMIIKKEINDKNDSEVYCYKKIKEPKKKVV